MRTDDGPHVLVYNETTVDGRITGYAGYAGDPGRYYRLGFRWPCDAILMGSVTAEAFGPAESAQEQASVLPPLAPAAIPPGFEELVREPRPLLVVPDSTGRVRCWRHAQAQPWYRGIVVLVCETTPAEYLAHLDHRGIEHLRVGGERVDLGLALRLLHERYRSAPSAPTAVARSPGRSSRPGWSTSWPSSCSPSWRVTRTPSPSCDYPTPWTTRACGSA